MDWLLLSLFAGLCLWFALEKARVDRARRGFRAVIHVSGIRGKTSVCRMLDAVLRAHFRVLTKTTGTDARVLHVDGRDLPIRRLGPANIREQMRALLWAKREGAEVVVLECMAVNPSLTRVSERAMVRADIAVITNVRHDHPFELGESLSQIAASLTGVIPENGTLYVADEAFFPFFEAESQKRGSRAVLCLLDDKGYGNVGIVRAVVKALGLTDEAIDAGLSAVRPDIGMRETYALTGGSGGRYLFVNLFAANDPLSAAQKLSGHLEGASAVRFLFNNRWDRPDRARLFAERFFPQYSDVPVFVLGGSKPLVRRLLKQNGVKRVETARSLAACLDMPEGSVLVGLGNIKGEGRRLLQSLADRHE